MQPSVEQFAELRQLLQTGTYDRDLRHHHSSRITTRSQATQSQWPAAPEPQQMDPRVQSRPSAAAGTFGRIRRSNPAPPAAPLAPLLVPAGTAAASRPATRSDVTRYLAQRIPAGADHRRSERDASAAAQQPAAPELHRRAKRGKPMARRSLQALFDAAAEDSSTWQQTSASCDTEDDADNGFASASSEETSLRRLGSFSRRVGLSTPSLAAKLGEVMGPNTPANWDSCAEVGEGSRPGSATSSQGGEYPTALPLRHLLMSERGRRLTSLEAKVIVLRVAEDLAALHAANAVHRRVAVDSISLASSPTDEGLVVAMLPPGRSAASMGSSRCHWAPRDPGTEALVPPEVACCPGDRMASFTPAGDMWGLGVVLFSLLSAGQLPFGETGVCCEGKTYTMDSLQQRLHRHLLCQVDVVNQLSAAQVAGNMSGDMEMEMRAVGFDPEAKSLLLGLLCADPAQRFTAADVLAHAWVEEAAPLVPQLPPCEVQQQHQHPRIVGKRPLQHDEAEPMQSPCHVQRCREQGGSASGSGSDPMMTSGTMQCREATPDSDSAPKPTTAAALMAAMCAATQQQQQQQVNLDSSPECPYPIIGHVAQPLEITVDGQIVTVSALHAVYAVPGHGAMMGAAPVAVADPGEVSAAAAAAANGDIMAPFLSQLLNQHSGGGLPGHHQL